MSLTSFIYCQSLPPSNGARLGRGRAWLFHLVRRTILAVSDPSCRMEIRGRRLAMPLSHELPKYIHSLPQYDALLGRLADFLRTRHGALCCIDVGANIGDTILACLKNPSDHFLAIEPTLAFFKYLQANVGGLPNVQLLQAACAAEDGPGAFRIASARGTARLESTTAGQRLLSGRLDTILERFPDFKACNFLKIDTDGHDFEVVRGATALLRDKNPAVLLECAEFSNDRYVQDVLETCQLFAKYGYDRVLVYDNAGYLFGQVALSQPERIGAALFYQLISRRCYFDLLFLRAADQFLQREIEYFLAFTAAGPIRTGATKASELMASL